MASAIAGAKYRGEFDKRLKGVLKEVSDAQGQVVMFIDEGAGGGGESGGMDAQHTQAAVHRADAFSRSMWTNRPWTHERYEMHHGVRIRDSALVAASNLANRYISDRFLPDEAIDLVTSPPQSSKCR
ncbi:unnamed protein product [Vitrella brassicaformis CCMP3155]|uniref:ClpA/ClpB AAA lid domain-containing protein n=1 Tax=Vitrella brassicaformis (strain CCMP3155) TaxID=1169540 RepID=A0A0G4H0P6_VITBC|nr:unnamed protein product [Vitrella brassicaformis CCMP3155]|eukprot:CEM37144.1 unnamed protein product [Vitrella brassicaformis CCMP3155]